MTTNITIERKISLDSDSLDANLHQNILNKIRKEYKNECNKEYGYFLEIKKLLKIKDNYISSNCENIFIILFEVEVLKPEKNKEFNGIVCMIFDEGLFINIKDKLKILIPQSLIHNYKYDEETNSFIWKKKKKFIKTGDNVSVKIEDVQYSNKNFCCYGELVESI